MKTASAESQFMMPTASLDVSRGELTSESTMSLPTPDEPKRRYPKLRLQLLLMLALGGVVLAVEPQPQTATFAGYSLPDCTLREMTGLPCPGCGLTRSTGYLTEGQWHEAWSINPASFALVTWWILEIALLVALIRRPSAALERVRRRARYGLLAMVFIAWVAALVF